MILNNYEYICMRLKVHQSAVASVIIVIKNCPHVVQSRAVPFLGLTLKFSRSGLYFICGDVFIHSSIIEKLQFLTNLKKNEVRSLLGIVCLCEDLAFG